MGEMIFLLAAPPPTSGIWGIFASSRWVSREEGRSLQGSRIPQKILTEQIF